ncbi:MAG: GntR family transcriptional regulator [Dermatophilaceae bacterium]
MAVDQTPGRRTPPERKVLRDTVHEQLFRMLVDGTLAPGARLSIDGLARDLCVSPTPVREALVHLEHTGLVRRAALRGYTIADPPSLQEITHLMAARWLVESAALGAAFDRSPEATPPVAVALSEALDAQRRAYDEVARHANFCPPAQLFAYLSAEWQFHRALVEQGGNRYLARMLELLAAEVHRGRRGDDGRPLDAASSLAEHAAIVAAVQVGDRESASAALKAHLEALRSRVRIQGRTQSD